MIFPPDNLWQSPQWEALHARLGVPHFRVGGVLFLVRELPVFGWNSLLCPRPSAALADQIIEQAVAHAAPHSPVMLRVAPGTAEQQPSKGRGVGACAARLPCPERFPRCTRVLDTADGQANFSQTGRRHLRAAQKAGVCVRSAAVEQVYTLLQKTGARQGFSLPPLSFFAAMPAALGPDIHFLLAEKDDAPLAAIVVATVGSRAVYLFGGSVAAPLHAPMALHAAAVHIAAQRGCTQYDLLGIPPPGQEAGHRLAGVGRFKQKLGGRVECVAPEFELPLRQSAHTALRAARWGRSAFSRLRGG